MDTWTRVLKVAWLAPGVLVSTVVWLMLAALVPAGSILLLCGVILVVMLRMGRLADPATRLLAGARRASAGEREVLEALAGRLAGLEVAAVQLRVGRSTRPHPAVRPVGRELVVSPALLEAVFHRQVELDEAAALVTHAVGRVVTQRTSADLALAAWTLPWQLVAGVVRRVGAAARWVPLVGLAWQLRAVVGVVAVVQSAAADRMASAVVVAVFITATYLTPVARRAWGARVQRVADQYVVAHGLGVALLGALQRIGASTPDLDRTTRLRHRPEPPARPVLRLVSA